MVLQASPALRSLPWHGGRYSTGGLRSTPYRCADDHLPLQLAHLLEAAVPRITEDDVIHEIDAHHHAGRRQPPRQLMIVRARRGIPRRMVVDNQHRRRDRSFY